MRAYLAWLLKLRIGKVVYSLTEKPILAVSDEAARAAAFDSYNQSRQTPVNENDYYVILLDLGTVPQVGMLE